MSIVLVLLVVFEICSLSVLFDRLTRYVPIESENVFPLTESTAVTKVKRGILNPGGNIIFAEEMIASPVESKPQVTFLGAQSANIGTLADIDTAYELLPLAKDDGITIWEGSSEFELFKVEYENENGDITVSGNGVDNLIAPGTSNSYNFTLKNTEDFSLDYEMEIKAYVSYDLGVKLPVLVRMRNHDGDYMLGDDDVWEYVLDINGVSRDGILAKDRFANYTIEWMWPFEGDDAIDTFFGNFGTSQGNDDLNLTLTIEVNTYAKQSADPDDPGDNPPQTGDNALGSIFIALIALIVAVAVVYYGKKRFDRSRIYD